MLKIPQIKEKSFAKKEKKFLVFKSFLVIIKKLGIFAQVSYIQEKKKPKQNFSEAYGEAP